MKANEAPKKLYFELNNNLIGLHDSAILGMFSIKNSETAIEYTRTDAFIEKACAFLETYPHMFMGMLRSDMIEDFKKYMEEQLWNKS